MSEIIRLMLNLAINRPICLNRFNAGQGRREGHLLPCEKEVLVCFLQNTFLKKPLSSPCRGEIGEPQFSSLDKRENRTKKRKLYQQTVLYRKSQRKGAVCEIRASLSAQLPWGFSVSLAAVVTLSSTSRTSRCGRAMQCQGNTCPRSVA